MTKGTASLFGTTDLEQAIAQALAMVGEVINVDRVTVFEFGHAGNAGTDLRWVWHGPEAPVLLTGETISTSTMSSADRAAWLAPLRERKPVVTQRRLGPAAVKDLLERMHVESMIVMPVFAGDTLWGSLGFHQCRAEREWTPVEIDVLAIFGDLIGSAMLRDGTRRSLEESEQRFRAMAREDPLTGLANRRVFVEAVEQAIVRARRGDQGFAVLYLDLDHFKDVNDTLGHPAGDQLLQFVADRLRSGVRESDLVARFGGDEFAMIAQGVTEATEVAALAERLERALGQPYSIGQTELRTGASIGMAVYGPDAPDAETLLSHADVALYRAKSDGRGTYRFFTDAMDAEVRTRVAVGSDLRAAIEGGQLFLVYQPQVELGTRRITGVEALVRWRHARRGLLGPGEFIPVAEKTGLIVLLGRWVLREACRQAAEWLRDGIAPLTVAVNVSGLQLKTPREFENTVGAALEETGLPPERLELELTESVLMDAWSKQGELIERLRAKGIKIAIDDFGTGFSSLEYLTRFPVDRIKIAQNFVRELAGRPENAAIVKATIGLARELRLNVIAEGVETAEQLHLLSEWGCRDVQGYCFARPLSAKDAAAMLRAGPLPQMTTA